MTNAGRQAENLAGPKTCMLLLDGTPEASLQFSSWFCAGVRGGLEFGLTAEGMAAWSRVVDSDRAVRWWQGEAKGKMPLPLTTLARGFAGVARITLTRDGEWEPADPPEHGDIAVTWCAARGDPAEALDLIAMDPVNPDRWWHRTGLVDVLPDDDDIDVLEKGQRIRLFRNPLSWLAAGCPLGSFCVLNWGGCAGLGLLQDIDDGRVTVVCDDDRHAADIRSMARPRRAAMHLQVAAMDGMG